jgi:hypothetical protein
VSKEKEALEKIKGLVETQVVRNEGEDNTPPSFLDIYNLACMGLDESTPLPTGITGISVTNPDTL